MSEKKKPEQATRRADSAAESFEIRRKAMTAEGFLDIWGVAAVANMALDYPKFGRTELVSAAALRESIDTLKDAVVTLGHPESGEVTPDNVERYQVGHVAEAAYDEESGEQRVRLRVTKQAAIDAIEKYGVKGLSPGYDAITRRQDGEYVQVSRLINHISIVPEGRGGERATLRTDSEQSMDQEELQKRYDALLAERDDLKSRLDEQQKRLDELEAERNDEEEEEQRNDAAFALARELVEAREVARRLDSVEITDDMMPQDIRRAVVLASGVEEGKLVSEDYTRARFDQIAERRNDEASKGSEGPEDLKQRWQTPTRRNDSATGLRISNQERWINQMDAARRKEDN